MSRLGFIYDQTRCIGCNTCQMACKDKNNLEKGMFYRRAVTVEADPWQPEATRKNCESPATTASIQKSRIWMHYSGSCNHCAHPACVKACPTGAMHITEDGTVLASADKCIGCGLCAKACPYHAISLSSKTRVAMKCDACADLRAKGQKPACVDACLTHCLTFGDIENLDSMDPDSTWTNTLSFLPDPSQTDPSLRIKPKKGGIHCD